MRLYTFSKPFFTPFRVIHNSFVCLLHIDSPINIVTTCVQKQIVIAHKYSVNMNNKRCCTTACLNVGYALTLLLINNNC